MKNKDIFNCCGYEEYIHKPTIITDKSVKIPTFLHYLDPTARKERTVFGQEKRGLFYNYEDRLYSNKWWNGLELAKKEATPNTARYYEIALNHFHDVQNVNLQHIILGCNMSNGNSYLIFGYTYGDMKTCE